MPETFMRLFFLYVLLVATLGAGGCAPKTVAFASHPEAGAALAPSDSE